MKLIAAILLTLTLLTGGANAGSEAGEKYYDFPKQTTRTLHHTPERVLVHNVHELRRRPMHRLHSRSSPYRPGLTTAPGGLVTVPTAAGIPIKVAAALSSRFQGFIKDLVDGGYTPRHISCWAPVGTHVPNSNHYHGGACDIDQTGWNRTAPRMYHVSSLATKWGLRDGCSFRRSDCGHIDDGSNIHWKRPNLLTKFIDWTMQPIKQLLPPFEE